MSEAQNIRGWRARLELRFETSAGRTVLAHRRHEGPLLVQRLFYPEEPGGACHAYIIHPPGGVVGGDDLTVEAEVRPGARALLTTPAAGKFYRKGSGSHACMQHRLCADDASLEWLPQENIFYPDAVAHVSTRVDLSGDARYIGWDIACLGLPANNASLGAGRLRSNFELWRNGRARLIENLTLDGDALSGRYGLAGLPVLGTLIATPAGTAQLEHARGCLTNCVGPTVACTLVEDVLACRTLARDAGAVRSTFEHLWRALRPTVIGRTATAPRIWAT